MWPLDRSRPTEWVRAGRHAVERWRGDDRNMVLAGSVPLDPKVAPEPEVLGRALTSLMGARPERAPLLMLESVWLPTSLADTGRTVWATREVEALVRHRFGKLYRDPADPVSGWTLRITHRAGDRYAWGFGLPRDIERAVLGVASNLGFRWSALLPASAWGARRLRPERVLSGMHGWWVWSEQDRAIVVGWKGGEVVALNPCAEVCIDEEDVCSAVRIEAARHGMPLGKQPVALARWCATEELPGPSERIRWMSVPGSTSVSAKEAA